MAVEQPVAADGPLLKRNVDRQCNMDRHPPVLSRRQLARMAFVRLLAGFVILSAMLFLPAGTLAFREAWAYIAVLFIPVTLVLAYLLKNDPGLLERRMRMKEKEAALGSWWGVIPAVPLVPILVVRIWNEEKVLAEKLVGYQEYLRTTRYRLVPGVW